MTPTCTTDCTTDLDQDSVPDCADGCLDADADGYGLQGGALLSTCLKVGGKPAPDCDDHLASVNPGALESGADVCSDELDNDCDGKTDCLDSACGTLSMCQ